MVIIGYLLEAKPDSEIMFYGHFTDRKASVKSFDEMEKT